MPTKRERRAVARAIELSQLFCTDDSSRPGACTLPSARTSPPASRTTKKFPVEKYFGVPATNVDGSPTSVGVPVHAPAVDPRRHHRAVARVDACDCMRCIGGQIACRGRLSGSRRCHRRCSHTRSRARRARRSRRDRGERCRKDHRPVSSRAYQYLDGSQRPTDIWLPTTNTESRWTKCAQSSSIHHRIHRARNRRER